MMERLDSEIRGRLRKEETVALEIVDQWLDDIPSADIPSFVSLEVASQVPTAVASEVLDKLPGEVESQVPPAVKSEVALTTVRSFQIEAEMLNSQDLVEGQRVQFSSAGQWIVKPKGFLPLGPTVKDGTIFQFVSTSLTQDCTFAEDTRTIAFLRSVYGSTGAKYPSYAGLKYAIDLSQVTTDPITTPGGVKLRPSGTVTPHHFGWTSTQTATQQTAAIQAAVDYVGSFAPLALNKAAGGGVVWFPAGLYTINDVIRIRNHCVVVDGPASNVALVRQTNPLANGFEFAAANTFNTGNTNPINSRLDNVGIRNIGVYCDGTNQTNAMTFTPVVMRRALGFIENCYFRGYHTGVLLSGVAEGTKVNGNYFSSERGGNVTAPLTGDAHIKVALEPVSVDDALAQAGGGGNYYDRSVGIYMANNQTKDPAGKYAVTDALFVEAVDGLYLSNNHFGFGARSQLCFDAPRASIGTLNVIADGLFLDGGTAIATGSSQYSILALDTYGAGAPLNDVQLTNVRSNVGSEVGYLLNRPALDGFKINVFSMNNINLADANQTGVQIKTGKNITLAHGLIGSCPGSFYVLIDNTGVVSNVTLDDINASDADARGAANEGIRVNLAFSGLKVTNCDMRDCNLLPMVIKGGTGSSTDFKVDPVMSSAEGVIASASSISLPAWTDTCRVTGTTNISNILSTAVSQGAWNKRRVTLIFEGILTVQSAGNMGLRSNFTTAVGSSLTFTYINGAWREVARLA